jgi:glutathione S-transferase
MLRLISYPPAFGQPSPSPFCVKAMCLLKMSGLEWEPEWQADPRKTPNGKLPVLRDGDMTIADSHFIRLHLEQAHGIDFDAGLDADARARALMAGRVLEEHLYWAIVQDRWFDEQNWAVLRDAYFAGIPGPVRGFVANYVRKQVRAQIDGHGIGRHGAQAIARLGAEDLGAMDQMLGDKPFMIGEAPSGLDATAGPFLAAAGSATHETELSRSYAALPRLAAYVERVKAAIYPDI